MKSPITGKEMELKTEAGFEIQFRKEKFLITHHFWLCSDSGEKFTDEALDNLDLNQVHNQYREKYGIPFPEEIKEIREKYGVSARKMSEILGLGANSWRNYEAGEVPSVANGRLILAVKNTEDFKRQVEASSALLTEKEKAQLLQKIALIEKQELETEARERDKIKVFPRTRPSQYNGYRRPNLEKAAHMVLFFAHQMPDLFKTKLNKLLFYADFLYFSQKGQSISGMEYRAIEYGPVPADYDKLLLRLSEDEKIELREKKFADSDYTGETIQPKLAVNPGLFDASEMAVFEDVANRFSKMSTKQLVELSHKEDGWKENVERKGLVSYGEWGFKLKIEK
jgi:putative zinc finger/helix-turn-helix YgiT family protein